MKLLLSENLCVMFCLFFVKTFIVFIVLSAPVMGYVDSTNKVIAWIRGPLQNLTFVYWYNMCHVLWNQKDHYSVNPYPANVENRVSS